MNLKNKIIVAALVVMASFTTVAANAQSITLGVEFGVRQLGGGECTGRGVCDMDVAGSMGVNVTFTTSSSNSDVLVMTFSMAALKASQPYEVALFLSASGSYPFDANWTVPSNIVSALGLSSGAQITTSSNTVVSVEGNVVTVYLTMSY